MGIDLSEFFEETYEILTPLDENGKTVLIKRKGTNGVYVRKEIDETVVDLYKSLSRIKNPNIAGVEQVYQSDGNYYAIEEYINGSTLREIMEYNRVITEEDAVNYCVQILEALFEIHRLGIIHRDISPQNIVVSNDGIVKLIDFGIARMEDPAKTKDTTILGTVGFAAPEQYGFSQTNEKSDIYAVGVLLNILLTGKLPNEQSPANVRLNMIIKKATHINPEARYKNATKMIEALNKTPLIAPLPGFRSGVLWKKVVATICYAVCGLFFTVYFIDALFFNRKDFALEIPSAFLSFIVSPLIAGNIFNWDRQIPIIRIFPMPIRFLIRLFVTVVILTVGFQMYVGVYPE